MTRKGLTARVTQAAETALAEQQYVAATDVLVGLGWLTPSHIDRWRQGRIESLESFVPVDASRVAAALTVLQRWAQERQLKPSETEYLARTATAAPCDSALAGMPPLSFRTAHTGYRQICPNTRSSGRANLPISS